MTRTSESSRPERQRSQAVAGGTEGEGENGVIVRLFHGRAVFDRQSVLVDLALVPGEEVPF
ncbi:hypothetical protein ABZ746_34370 [Streptomyces sp. NPDC020096]